VGEFFLDSAPTASRRGATCRLARRSIWCRFHQDHMRDRIVAIGQSEDYEPHVQRHFISNFRLQPPPTRSCACRRTSISLRTFPGGAASTSSRASTTTASRSPARACNFREKLCVLDSDVPPEALIYPI